MFRMPSELNLILMMAADKSQENQQKVSYIITLIAPETYYF